MHRARTLRRHLFQVLLAGILPVGVFAAVLLFMLWQAQESERRRVQAETTRLLATAVEHALASTEQRLGILARQWAVRPGGDAELFEAARAAQVISPDWENMLAFKASGEGIFRLDRPYGTAIPSMHLRDYSAAALKEHRPTLSNLFVNRTNGKPVVGVAYPVSRDGVVTHVLIASLNLQWFDALLNKQRLPPGGIGGIFDRQMKFVARSHDGEPRRGGDPAAALHADMKRNPEGIGRYPSLDNTYVYTSWTRTRHGWWVAFATPAAPIDGAFWRHMWLLGGMLVAVILAGLAFAALQARKITASFEETLHAAEQANRAKDEFIAMLGHELRNPLAAVMNAVTIVRSSERTPQEHEFAAGVIHRQAGHLKRLIDDLLDVGRVMTGKILPDRRPLDLQATVQQVVSSLETAGTFAKHRLQVQTEPVWINGDHTRLEQVVCNLLVNATTYTPAGGAIAVTLAAENGEAVLRVRDDGVGIPAENLQRIFELFFQGEPSGRRTHSGLGIGLTLVRRLVELHGGSVSAESEGPGRGATLTVRIPSTAAQAIPAATPAVPKGSPRTVLIVEDNADERESLRIALELHGHRVLQAADARAALARLRAGKPDIALIDIGLPGMDGYALAREIRASHDAHISLIALTGYGAPDDRRRALDAGFTSHLTKPVEVAELAAIVAGTVS